MWIDESIDRSSMKINHSHLWQMSLESKFEIWKYIAQKRIEASTKWNYNKNGATALFFTFIFFSFLLACISWMMLTEWNCSEQQHKNVGHLLRLQWTWDFVFILVRCTSMKYLYLCSQWTHTATRLKFNWNDFYFEHFRYTKFSLSAVNKKKRTKKKSGSNTTGKPTEHIFNGSSVSSAKIATEFIIYHENSMEYGRAVPCTGRIARFLFLLSVPNQYFSLDNRVECSRQLNSIGSQRSLQ